MCDRVAEEDSSHEGRIPCLPAACGLAIGGGGAAAYAIASRGLSTGVAPSARVTASARTRRRFATPSVVRGAANPVQPTPEVLEEALGHFADHCAACHANDGSGNTDMGRSFYPAAPDMRVSRTQQLS